MRISDWSSDVCSSDLLVNCSHPLEYEPALDDGAWTRRLRGVRPNASKMEKMALCKLDHLEDGNPVELALQLSDLHARYPTLDVFGGCCGTGAAHLLEIAKALRPSLQHGRESRRKREGK